MEDQTIAIATHQKLHHHHHQQHLADAVPVIIRTLVDHFLRLRLQLFLLMLSISLLSILSLTMLVLPYNNLFCLSTTLIFSLTLDRKYMFLLCNGILAVLARSFCFSTGTTSVVVPDPDDTDAQLEIDVSVTASVGCDETELPAGGNLSLLEANGGGREDEALATEDKGDRVEEEQEEVEEEIDGGLEINEETSAATAASEVVMADNSKEELMSAEELNKKIEEFIRKMKEEIRIEAQTQLIAV